MIFGRDVTTTARSVFGSEVRVKLCQFDEAFNGGAADLKSDSNLGLVAGSFDSRYDTFS